jgi:hypothetical protein
MPLKDALAKSNLLSLLRSFIAIFILMSNFLPFGDVLYSTQFSFLFIIFFSTNIDFFESSTALYSLVSHKT